MAQKRDESIEVALSYYRSNKISSLRATAKTHNLSLSTLSTKINGRTSRRLTHQRDQRLAPGEESFLAEWNIGQDHQGFPPILLRTKEMTERILQIHGGTNPLGNKWINQFGARHPEVSSYIKRRIDTRQVQGTQADLVEEF